MFSGYSTPRGTFNVANWLLLSFPVEVTKLVVASMSTVDLRDAWTVNPSREAVEVLMREFPEKSFSFGYQVSAAEHYSYTRKEFSEACLQEILDGTLDPESHLGSYVITDGRVRPKLLAEVLKAVPQAEKIHRDDFNWGLVSFSRLADFRKYGVLDHKKVEITQEHVSHIASGYNNSGLTPREQLDTFQYLLKCMPRRGEAVNQILAQASRISADFSAEELRGFVKEAFLHVGKQDRKYLGEQIRCMNGHTPRQEQWMEPIRQELAAINVNWVAAKAKANTGGPKAAARSARSAEFLRDLRIAADVLHIAPETWETNPALVGYTAAQEEVYTALCEFMAEASRVENPTTYQKKILGWFRGQQYGTPVFQSERISTIARSQLAVKFIRFAADNPGKVNWEGIQSPGKSEIFASSRDRAHRYEDFGGLTYRGLIANSDKEDLQKVIRSIPVGSNWRIFFGSAGVTAWLGELTEDERTTEVLTSHFRNSPHDTHVVFLPTIESMVKYISYAEHEDNRDAILRKVGDMIPFMNRIWPAKASRLRDGKNVLELLDKNYLKVPVYTEAAARYMNPVCDYVYEHGGISGAHLFMDLLTTVDSNAVFEGKAMTLKEVVDTALAGAS